MSEIEKYIRERVENIKQITKPNNEKTKKDCILEVIKLILDQIETHVRVYYNNKVYVDMIMSSYSDDIIEEACTHLYKFGITAKLGKEKYEMKYLGDPLKKVYVGHRRIITVGSKRDRIIDDEEFLKLSEIANAFLKANFENNLEKNIEEIKSDEENKN